jgi:hypothetical protein
MFDVVFGMAFIGGLVQWIKYNGARMDVANLCISSY